MPRFSKRCKIYPTTAENPNDKPQTSKPTRIVGRERQRRTIDYKLRNQPFILSRMPLPSSTIVFVSRTYRIRGKGRGKATTRAARGRAEHPM